MHSWPCRCCRPLPVATILDGPTGLQECVCPSLLVRQVAISHRTYDILAATSCSKLQWHVHYERLCPTLGAACFDPGSAFWQPYPLLHFPLLACFLGAAYHNPGFFAALTHCSISLYLPAILARVLAGGQLRAFWPVPVLPLLAQVAGQPSAVQLHHAAGSFCHKRSGAAICEPAVQQSRAGKGW